MNKITLAAKIAASRLKGKFDLNGKPLTHHAAAVGLALSSMGPEFVIAGLLHEVMKEPDMKLEELRSLGFSDEVINGLDAVTRRDGEDYSDYIVRVKKNPIGRNVKIADVTDNLSICVDHENAANPDESGKALCRERAEKYGRILGALISV